MEELGTSASYEQTQMAMQGMQARYAGDDRLMVQFDVYPMLDDEKSAQEGRPIFKDVEHIRIMQPGNKESIIHRPITEMDKARFAQRYQAWKAGEKEILEGTPLEMWPTVTRSQVEELKFFNIRTVEQLATVPDVHAQKFMGIQILKRQAQAYLDAAKENAGTTKLMSELEQRDNQIAALQQAITDLQAQMAESQPPKRGGRPPRASSSG